MHVGLKSLRFGFDTRSWHNASLVPYGERVRTTRSRTESPKAEMLGTQNAGGRGPIVYWKNVRFSIWWGGIDTRWDYVNRSFRDFQKMGRVVIVTKDSTDFAVTERIYGPYETVGIAKAMMTKITDNMRYDDIVDCWVEETTSVTWERSA